MTLRIMHLGKGGIFWQRRKVRPVSAHHAQSHKNNKLGDCGVAYKVDINNINMLVLYSTYSHEFNFYSSSLRQIMQYNDNNLIGECTFAE